jgi:hypothetical protein
MGAVDSAKATLPQPEPRRVCHGGAVESLRKPKIFREFACLQCPNGTEIEPGIGCSMLLLAIRLPAAPGRSAARSAAV